ncbi:hypothetical protein GPALN_005057 [Globodera pallida]|nr:hypothetical protein GPALN_005057 [Globodera pallida]
MNKLFISFTLSLLFGIAFGAISEELKCFRAIIEGAIQGVEDRIEKRKIHMKKSERFSLVPLNLRTHVQDKLKTFLNGEKSPKAFVALEEAMKNAKSALSTNAEYAKTAVDKIAEMFDDIEMIDQRIDGLQKLLEEHKNSPIRLSDLKGKKTIMEIPEIENEINEILKLDILKKWTDCPSKEIVFELLDKLKDFPRKIAIELAGRFVVKPVEFALSKFMGISDLYYVPQFLVYNCTVLDLATHLAQGMEENEGLLSKFEKSIQLSAIVARLATLDNEGHKQKEISE